MTLIEIEQRILGSLLINNDLAREIRDFAYSRRRQALHFTDPVHRAIWTAIVEVITSGGIANPVTLFNRIADVTNAKYITQLVNASVTNREEFRVTLEKWWWPWYLNYLQTDEWKEKRQLVLDRCEGLCEGCRIADVTQVHHLSYRHAGDEFLFELVGLCEECHKRIHQKYPEPR